MPTESTMTLEELLFDLGDVHNVAPCMLQRVRETFEAKDAEIARMNGALASAQRERDEACGFMTLQTMETGKLRLALARLAGLDALDPAITTDACVKRIEQRERDVRHAAEAMAVKAVEDGAERLAALVEPRIKLVAEEIRTERARRKAITGHAIKLRNAVMGGAPLGAPMGDDDVVDRAKKLGAFLVSAEPLIGDYMCDRARTHERFDACRAALKIAESLGQVTP